MDYALALGITHYPNYGYHRLPPQLPWTRDRTQLTDDLGIERVVTVERIPAWYMPGNVLGWTDGERHVVLRDDLDILAYRGDEFVRLHEFHHIMERDPQKRRNEPLIDARALREMGLSYRPI